MKRLFAVLLLAALAPQVVAAGLTGTYKITVLENGNAQVLLSLNGTGTINIPLPLDVPSPSVEGGLYLDAPNGIDLFVGTARRASVGYESTLLTTKSDAWNFEMLLPNLDGALITVSMPRDVEIINASPNASVTKTSVATELRWNLSSTNGTAIAARYRFVALQNETRAETPAPQPQVQQSYAIYALVFVILFAVIATLALRLRKPEEIRATSGAENVMKTLTENELTIVKLLLANGGGMKRNKLERESKLAKSSLASALYRLEQRNIVNVDKTSAVHYVKLTDWFRSL